MRRFQLLILVMVSLMGGIAYGYDNRKAHPDITIQSIEISRLDDYLKSYLELPLGVDTRYDRQYIVDLLRSGSTNEDKPMMRSLNHFWNPL